MEDSKQQIKKTVKKHIPKDWLCDLRIAYRIVIEAVNDIKRTGIINLVIITTMAAILTLFGVLFRFTLSLSTFANLATFTYGYYRDYDYPYVYDAYWSVQPIVIFISYITL